jgi:hypothetical protein
VMWLEFRRVLFRSKAADILYSTVLHMWNLRTFSPNIQCLHLCFILCTSDQGYCWTALTVQVTPQLSYLTGQTDQVAVWKKSSPRRHGDARTFQRIFGVWKSNIVGLCDDDKLLPRPRIQQLCHLTKCGIDDTTQLLPSGSSRQQFHDHGQLLAAASTSRHSCFHYDHEFSSVTNYQLLLRPTAASPRISKSVQGKCVIVHEG